MDEIIVVNKVEQRSPEWFQQRLGKVTASRVADIMAKTKSGYSTSRGNYLMELALQRITGNLEQGFMNDAMQWGVDTEAQARMAYEVYSGEFVTEVGFVDHPMIAWLGASPDGLVGEHGLVETKCPNSRTHWETIKSKRIPEKYTIQMFVQMMCTGRAWCDFVSFDPRMPERSQLFVARLFWNDERVAEIQKEVIEFLAEVDAEVKLMRGE
jgi:putative phage-type endonuclease